MRVGRPDVTDGPVTIVPATSQSVQMKSSGSLCASARRRHPQITRHVDRLPTIADMIGRIEPADLRAHLERECRFLVNDLQPYMKLFETRVYEPLERLMEGRHSLSPMRDEHARVRRLIGMLEKATENVDRLTDADSVSLRRILYRLHSIVKVHLAEEELYLGVLDGNLSESDKDELARAIEHAGAEPL